MSCWVLVLHFSNDILVAILLLEFSDFSQRDRQRITHFGTNVSLGETHDKQISVKGNRTSFP